MVNDVYISKSTDNIKKRLIEGLKWINWKEIKKNGSKIIVKPNLVWQEYMPAVTTHPDFLNELLGVLNDQCETIIVGESNGPKFNVEQAFESHGLYEICKNNGADLCNFSKQPSEFVKTTVGSKNVKIELPKMLLDDENIFITVPILKTHVFTTISVSLKNQWGCIPDSMRMLYHPILNEGIVAINKVIKPDVSIVDPTYAMDGNGPVWGEAKKINLLMVSNDLVAVDAVGSLIMGFDPAKIEHLRKAEQEKLGVIDLEKININEKLPDSLDFKVKMVPMDYLGKLSCSTNFFVKTVYDSKLTPIIYKVLRREPPKRIR